MDKVTQERIALLHPKIRDEVTAIIAEVDKRLKGRATIRLSQGLRTIAEQNELYALGRTKVNPTGKSAKKPMGSIVTNAKGGSSFHNFGLAVDFVLIIDGKTASWNIKMDWDNDKVSDWMEVVEEFAEKGYEWGGNWKSLKDYPHFQKTFGYSLNDLRIKQNKKDFIKGTTYLNL